jgi:hypothetical protein
MSPQFCKGQDDGENESDEEDPEACKSRDYTSAAKHPQLISKVAEECSTVSGAGILSRGQWPEKTVYENL